MNEKGWVVGDFGAVRIGVKGRAATEGACFFFAGKSTRVQTSAGGGGGT